MAQKSGPGKGPQGINAPLRGKRALLSVNPKLHWRRGRNDAVATAPAK